MQPGFLGVIVSQVGTPPGIVQIQRAVYGSTTQLVSHSVTLGSTPVAGHVLILMVVADITVSGTPPGYTLVTSAVDFTGTYMYWKISDGGDAGALVNLSATKSCCLAMYEYSGITTVDVNDANTAQGTASVVCGPTSTTTATNELVVALIGLSQGNSSTQPTVTSWTNSFVTDVNDPNTGIGTIMRLVTGIKIVSVTGAQSTTATLSAAGSANNSSIIATFK